MKKILIIENDCDIRMIVEFILQEQGFETFNSPELPCFEAIKSFDPDLILLDEFVNIRPSVRICRKIKETPELAAVPIIILSTADNIEMIALQCDVDDFIRKPFDIEEMIDKVKRTINVAPLSLPS